MHSLTPSTVLAHGPFATILVAGLLLQSGSPASPQEGVSVDALIDSLPSWKDEWLRDPMSTTGRPLYNKTSAELQQRLSSGLKLNDTQWTNALLKSEAIQLRPRWPVSQPFAISIQVPAWLYGAEVTVTPKDPRLNSVTTRTQAMGCALEPLINWRADHYRELGMLPIGAHRTSLHVVIGKTNPEVPETIVVEWQGDLPITVEMVQSIDEVLSPWKGPSIDKAVRESMSLRFSGCAWLELEVNTARDPLLQRTSVSLAIDVCLDGEVVESGTLVAVTRDPTQAASIGREHRWMYDVIALNAIPESAWQSAHERSRWSLQVSSDDRSALEVWDADKRWVGSFSMPLSEVIGKQR